MGKVKEKNRFFSGKVYVACQKDFEGENGF